MKGESQCEPFFLSSSGLNENTARVFWECVKKEPADTKAIIIPSAAVGNDSAREGIAVCVERLMNMGISLENIFIYDLSLLLSAGYERTYSNYIQDIPTPLRLMSAEELNQFDIIVFCGGNASTLLNEVNRTGLSDPLKQAIENGLIYLGISAGSMIAARNFADGLGYLTNEFVPHAEKGTPCGEVPQEGLIALVDGQVVFINGEEKEIIC